jgi:hypothetical protein
MNPSESGARKNGQRRAHGAGDDAGALTVGQRVDRINGTAQEAWSRTNEAVKNLKDTLDIDNRIDRHPYGMLAAAVGVGYVLGGGIFSPLTSRIVGLGLRMGLRLAALPFLERELLGLAESVGGGSGAESASAGGRAAQPSNNPK